jgi:hypothetical protein
MTAFQSNERRLVLRILELWEILRGARRFPSVADVEAADFGADWADCFLIAIGATPEQSAFRYVGGGLMVPDWGEVAGRAVTVCPDNTLLGHASSYMAKVLDKRVPISLGGEFETGGTRIMYRSIMLPLSDNDTCVNFLFGAANSRQEARAGALANGEDSQQA